MIRVLLQAALAAAFFFAMPSTRAWAQDVTLTSRDGSIEISGTLQTFDGEFYRVETEFGLLVLDGQGVICRGSGCPNLEDYVARFSFAGATGIGEVLLPTLIETFAARRGLRVRRTYVSDQDFRISLWDETAGRLVAEIGFNLTSTEGGFAAFLDEETDIVMALREVRAAEVETAQSLGFGNLADPARSRIVALDALVPVVARGNPQGALAVGEIAAILAGEKTDWDTQQAPILLQGLSADSGLQQAVQDLLLTPAGAMPAAFQEHADEVTLSDAIARDPLAFGIVRFSEIGNGVALPVAGNCGMQLAATRRNLKTEDYPFTLPLFLYLPEERLPLFAREFLKFIGTPAAQGVIRRLGFVDQGRERISLEEQGNRLRNAVAKVGDDAPLTELQRMLNELDGSVRLTTTFRFRGGSTELDAQSSGNVADLARALESGFFAGRELVFAGFSDGEGGWEANRTIARRRAEAVREAVRRAAFAADPSATRLTVAAYGEALPMACDDEEWGRSVNRRVEVWLR